MNDGRRSEPSGAGGIVTNLATALTGRWDQKDEIVRMKAKTVRGEGIQGRFSKSKLSASIRSTILSQ